MDLLPSPILTKELSSGENNILRYGSCAMQGWRKRMEDSHITDISKGENERFNIFGVFDGHGGKEVAEFVSNHFTEYFLQNEKIKKNNIKQAIIDTFLKMDELMFQKSGIEELKKISIKGIIEINSDDINKNMNLFKTETNKDIDVYINKEKINVIKENKKWNNRNKNGFIFKNLIKQR